MGTLRAGVPEAFGDPFLGTPVPKSPQSLSGTIGHYWSLLVPGTNFFLGRKSPPSLFLPWSHSFMSNVSVPGNKQGHFTLIVSNVNIDGILVTRSD